MDGATEVGWSGYPVTTQVIANDLDAYAPPLGVDDCVVLGPGMNMARKSDCAIAGINHDFAR